MRTGYWRNAELVRIAIVGGLFFAAAMPVWAQSPRILQIEEQWEMQLGEPDVERSAPQTTMVMSPHEDLAEAYFLFTVNHRALPDFAPGGVQVQMWNGEVSVVSAGVDLGALDQAHDTIRWTQRLKVEDGTLTFEVVDGSSESWGDFGGETLTLSTPTSLEGLKDYSPAISLTESQIGYAGNRVTSLVLKKLVWLTDDGETHELNAPIDIDADLDP